MAKKDTEIEEVVEVVPGKTMFVLKKSHGLVMHGRESKFYAAGTEFDPETDALIIAELAKSGAQIEQK